MSFTTEIKNEICSNSYSRLENICLLSGFLRNNAEVLDDEIVIVSENPKVVRKIFALLKEIFDISPVINSGKSTSFKKNYFNILIDDKFSVILSSLMIKDNGVMFPSIPSYFLDTEDLKRAYLRGVFLAKGSINDPKKSRYHMEFLVDRKDEAYFIVSLLSYFDINSKVIPRDNATPHILLLHLFDKYEERLWNSVVEQTPFHKLTYKFDECQTNLSNTFYQYIMND